MRSEQRPNCIRCELFDDRSEELDLGVAMTNGGSNVAHQTLREAFRIGKRLSRDPTACPLVLKKAYYAEKKIAGFKRCLFVRQLPFGLR